MPFQLPCLPQERLNERSDAALAIARCLEALHEPSWAPVLFEWLDRYGGLDQYLWPEQFARALSELRFCRCAARHDDCGLRWDPLRDDPFETWTGGRIVTVWDMCEPGPSLGIIHAWLLIRFCRARTQTH
jgi:hypothetical protein